MARHPRHFTPRQRSNRVAPNQQGAAAVKRDAIALTPAEEKSYIATAKTLTLCTQGPHGYPHAVAMWFAVDDDGTVWMTTYRKSQKGVNVRRNSKVALHIES